MINFLDNLKKNVDKLTLLGAVAYASYYAGTKRPREVADVGANIDLYVYEYLDKLFVYLSRDTDAVQLLDVENREIIQILDDTFDRYFIFKKVVNVDLKKEVKE